MPINNFSVEPVVVSTNLLFKLNIVTILYSLDDSCSMMIPIATSSSLLAIAIASIARGGGGLIPPPAPSTAVIEKLFSEFYKLPEGFRFFISGNTGNIVFYTFDRLLYSGLCRVNDLPGIIEEYKHAVTFFLAYLIQVVSQHWLNALFVYGLESISTKEKYLKTLVGCYRVYVSMLIYIYKADHDYRCNTSLTIFPFFVSGMQFHW